MFITLFLKHWLSIFPETMIRLENFVWNNTRAVQVLETTVLFQNSASPRYAGSSVRAVGAGFVAFELNFVWIK